MREGSRRRLVGLLAAAWLTASASMSVAGDGGGYGLISDEAQLREQVHEPFFAFIFIMTDRDSLGTWTPADLLAFADAWGQPSVFPLATCLESLTREAVPAGEVERRRGVDCARRWVICLQPPRLDLPMPYSILGYRPGTLSFDGPLVLREWRLGERELNLTVDDQNYEFTIDGMTVFQLATGWIILDVDAWLDNLLGKSLDDTATEGFILGRVETDVVGVGNSVGRTGRRIFGELDFRSGKVENNGRPLSLAMSRYGRAWTRPPDYDHRAIWDAYQR
ncbi:MAG: hypothetical protein RBT60_12170 [Candidatus Krumholzibacteria bacterium]|jgi:hypothetical protein|nr:hypothetical protein [Candidatus Krumholzibacteria bacterium]